MKRALGDGVLVSIKTLLKHWKSMERIGKKLRNLFQQGIACRYAHMLRSFSISMILLVL